MYLWIYFHTNCSQFSFFKRTLISMVIFKITKLSLKNSILYCFVVLRYTIVLNFSEIKFFWNLIFIFLKFKCLQKYFYMYCQVNNNLTIISCGPVSKINYTVRKTKIFNYQNLWYEVSKINWNKRRPIVLPRIIPLVKGKKSLKKSRKYGQHSNAIDAVTCWLHACPHTRFEGHRTTSL